MPKEDHRPLCRRIKQINKVKYWQYIRDGAHIKFNKTTILKSPKSMDASSVITGAHCKAFHIKIEKLAREYRGRNKVL